MELPDRRSEDSDGECPDDARQILSGKVRVVVSGTELVIRVRPVEQNNDG